MTIGEWLATREPAPPDLLRAGVESAVGANTSRDKAEGTTVFLEAAERMLSQLVASRETGREIAGDLLVVDALTTYAVEIATETLADFEVGAQDAVARFANLLKPGSY
jgi:hypothetical protein